MGSGGGIDYPITITLKAINDASGAIDKLNDKLGSIGKKHGEKHEDVFETLAKGTTGKGLANLLGVSAFAEIGTHLFEIGSKLVEFGKEAFEVVKQLVESTVAAGVQLGELARRTGLSVNALSEWQYAAKQSHVDSEEFTASLDQMNKRMGELRGGGGALLKGLMKYAPVLANQLKHTKSNEEALDLLSRAFTKLKDPQERAALATLAFGKNAKNMGVFLGQGVDKLKELREEGKGLIGDQTEFVHNSEEAEEAINRVSTAFDALKNQTIAALLPALEPVFSELTKLLSNNREELKAWAHDVRAGIQAWFDGGGIDRVEHSMRSLSQSLKQVYYYGKLAFDLINAVTPNNPVTALGNTTGTYDPITSLTATAANAALNKVKDVTGFDLRSLGRNTLAQPRGQNSTATDADSTARAYGLTVDFKNMPRGARVRGNGGPAVDYSVGYNMGAQ